MFEVLDLTADGKLVPSTGDAAVALPPEGTVRWIDLVAPDPGALALLKERFGFHSLALSDCADYGLESKVDDYDDHLFVVIHGFSAVKDQPYEIQIHEVHAFLGERYLVTVHDNKLPALDDIWAKAAASPAVLERGPSWALYQQIDAMVDATEPLVDRLAEVLDELETRIIEHEHVVLDLSPVFKGRRSAAAMSRVLEPLRDTVRTLHRHPDSRITPRTAQYLRDVADHVARLAKRVADVSDQCHNIIAAYQALQTSRTNEVMKRLTIFSAVFLPLGFIVGFFGQNFTGLPMGDDRWMWAMLASMVVVPAGLLWWIKARWL
ncbi:MAG: magnesium transporter CorA family protein [Deltaproteobacteria bacterium]|nr:magnesium transporter CorA family protein [Deltaproteobacteria bacterium]